VEVKILSNLSKVNVIKPVWRPMDVLKNVDVQNTRFLQDDYSRPRTAHFKGWAPEELPIEKALPASQAASDTNSLQVAEQKSASAISSIDKDLLEKEKEQAYTKGLKDGEDKAKVFAEKEAAKVRLELETSTDEKIYLLMQDIQTGIDSLRQAPHLLHEPLKRLALHLAEQLTLTELSVSSHSIDALVSRCIETLDMGQNSPIVVELNPSDMAVLQSRTPEPGEEEHTWRLQADTTLLPGSVRVRANDAVVTDLVEHRLQFLAHSLLSEPKNWQAQSAFQPERLHSRRGQANTVEDALLRESSTTDLIDEDNMRDTNDMSDTPDLNDVLDAERKAEAAALNLASMDLPDLELDVSPKPDSNEALDSSHE
jgi:flagellar biosynthesis/type III secretory pathway protein FliH